MRSVWIISLIIAIGLTTSAPAQQQVDQVTRQQIELLTATFVETWNEQDAAGLARFFTTDGVLVTPGPDPLSVGPQKIEQHYLNNFKRGETHNESTVEQVWPLGIEAVISYGTYRLTGQGQSGPINVAGHWTAVDVREGGTWKARIITALGGPPPSPTAQQGR